MLEQLNVLPDRIEAFVRIEDACYRATSPELIERVVQQFPTIAYHTCRNQFGPTFASVMRCTSIPHLLEHLVIDIQTHQHAEKSAGGTSAEQATFTGTTQWSAEDPSVAIVRVSFLDDLIALGAFKKALHFINQTLAQDVRA